MKGKKADAACGCSVSLSTDRDRRLLGGSLLSSHFWWPASSCAVHTVMLGTRTGWLQGAQPPLRRARSGCELGTLVLVPGFRGAAAARAGLDAGVVAWRYATTAIRCRALTGERCDETACRQCVEDALCGAGGALGAPATVSASPSPAQPCRAPGGPVCPVDTPRPPRSRRWLISSNIRC
jgi:hypothetical protein